MNNDNYIFYEVWDSLTRTLHWINVFSIIVLSVLGGILYYRIELSLSNPTIASIVSYHVYVGYVLTGSLIVRWIWLFAGPPFSSWKDIVPHTKEQWDTLKETIVYYIKGFRGAPPFYVAHNPFAGIAYTTFFIILSIQAIAGLILNQVPPLPSGEREPPYLLILTHNMGFYFILLFIVAHVSAIILHEISEDRSIVSSMIHGKKVFRRDDLERIESYKKSLEEEEEE